MLKIRLRQQGRKNRQTYRLVVTDIRNPRDGKYLEMLGWYNPFSASQDCMVNGERINYWMGLGAELSESAETLIERIAPHIIKEIRAKTTAKQLKNVQKRRALKQKAKAAKPAKA
ncbi:MAG TPA: 30S ribosomal protein S16 [Rhabdochlamydiaceae bacterium]|jgi:small subunit ribosomal protein S16